MMVSVAEKVTVCPSSTIWSTLIKLVEQLSGVIWIFTILCPLVSTVCYYPLSAGVRWYPLVSAGVKT